MNKSNLELFELMLSGDDAWRILEALNGSHEALLEQIDSGKLESGEPLTPEVKETWRVEILAIEELCDRIIFASFIDIDKGLGGT